MAYFSGRLGPELPTSVNEGLRSLPAAEARAERLATKACGLGHPRGCSMCATLKLTGKGEARDVPGALKVLEKRCDEAS